MNHLKKFENHNDDIEFDWKYFKKYVNTYDPERDAGNDWHSILDDMLYGLGVSLDKENFQYGEGYEKFKEYLKDGIDWKLKKSAKKYNL